MTYFDVIVINQVENEIQEAYNWYESKQKDLGKNFLEDLQDGFISLESNPYFQKVYKDFRSFKLKRFPYYIHYKIDEAFKKVYVYSIYHTSRKSKF